MDKPTLRLLICGGRNYAFTVADVALLNGYHEKYEIVEVVHGGAAGADSEGKEWAEWHGLKTREFKADWLRLGKAAGPRRNAEMAGYLHEFHCLGEKVLIVAFPGSSGTSHMVSTARRYGLPVVMAADEIKKREAENGTL